MPPEAAADPRGRRLAAELLRAGLTVRLRVHGTSMAPALRPGDRVEIAPLDRPARRGELVYAELPGGGFVLHRVLRRLRGGRVQTRGDAHWRLDDALPRARLLGRVRRVRRGGAPWRGAGRAGALRVLAALARSWLCYRRAAARAGQPSTGPG